MKNKMILVYKYVFVIVISMIVWSCGHNASSNQSRAEYNRDKDSIAKIVQKIWHIDSLKVHYDNSVKAENHIKQMVLANRLGKQFRNKSDFSNAIKYNSIALDIAQKLNDTTEIIVASNSLGTNFRRIGAFDKAIGYHNSALEYAEGYSHQDSKVNIKNTAISYNGIGNISLSLGYHNDAMRSFKKALELEKHLGSYIGQAINYANIGAMFNENNELDSAMWYHRKSMEANIQAKSDLGISLCYSNIGAIYEKKSMLDTAQAYYTKSYQYASKINDIWHKTIAYISMGRVNVKLGNLSEAQMYLQEALRMAQYTNASELKIEIYELLHKYYKKRNNKPQALYYLEQSNAYADSVNDENDRNILMETRMDFERKQNQKKEAMLIAENEAQRTRSLYIALAGIILVLFLFMLFILMRRLKNAETKRADMLNEMNNIKNKFFSIISHDLKNVSHSINKSISLMAHNELPEADKAKLMSELSISSDLQVELLDSLLNWARIETGRIEFNPTVFNVKGLLTVVVRQLSPCINDKNIFVNIECPADLTIKADFNMMSVVVRNIISNAIKFSYSDTSIDIKATLYQDNYANISITDHGVGMTPESIDNCFRLDRPISIDGTCGEKGTGLGLLVSREMLNKHNSKLEIKSEFGKGSTFSFVLPTS